MTTPSVPSSRRGSLDSHQAAQDAHLASTLSTTQWLYPFAPETHDGYEEDDDNLIDHRHQSISMSHNSRSKRSPTIGRGRSATLIPDTAVGSPPKEDHHDIPVVASSSGGSTTEEEDVGVRRGHAEPLQPPDDLSRRSSMIKNPEADVCFPLPPVPPVLPLQPTTSSTPEDPYQSHFRGFPGVLPKFLYPFDFEALEDWAKEEKQELENAKRERRPTVAFVSTRDDGMLAGRLGGRMDIKRRPNRRLSESIGPVRQKKLALFEDNIFSGTSTGTGSGPNLGGSAKGKIDHKTPLLSSDTGEHPSFHTFGRETAAKDAPQSTTFADDRPYRFSFYSNSLPATIHAKSLSELPDKGQTFKALFVGPEPTPPPSNEGSTHAHLAEDLRWTHGHGNSGAGSNMTNLGGSFGGGASGGATRRHPLMRTDEDAEANTWWLDVLCPTDGEMKVLSKAFGIHPLTMEDVLTEEAREKIELFGNYYLVSFRSFDQDPYSQTYLEPLNMYIIVFREGTLSFHFRGTPHPQNVRRRIKQLKDYINVTSDWISYALIDDITDAFGPLIQGIQYEVDSVDELVLILKDTEQSDMLRRIGTSRKKVMGLLRLMGNKADVVKGLAKRCNENWSVTPKSDIGLYLSDIQDHLITMNQNLNHYEKILSRSHSNYLAQISIEMTEANNQINDVLGRLTALGTILLPMNLITGLWGMNVHVPGQDVDNLHWFFSILAGLAAIAICGAWIAYRVFVR